MMRKIIHILTIAGLLLSAYGCDKSGGSHEFENGDQGEITGGLPIPEGYFEVVLSSRGTRAAISGSDGRIQDLRYILFDSEGNFVKEKHIVAPENGAQSWPIAAVRDTLPKGSYKAVLVGNTEKTLFPYHGDQYSDVLTGYQNGYSAGRITLPPAEFSDDTEYYMANVDFSDTNPTPYILLQRIISRMNLTRNFVDAQDALNMLVGNIVTNIHSGNVIGYEDIIQAQVTAILPGLIENALTPVSGLGLLLDDVVNTTASTLVAPVTDALYQQLLAQLTDQVGATLAGTSGTTLDFFFNPWTNTESRTAVVTIDNFPKSIDFDRNVQESFGAGEKFKFSLRSINNDRGLFIKGFHGLFDVKGIEVMKDGPLGLLFDVAVDDNFLLDIPLVEIHAPIDYTTATNFSYKADYSLLDVFLQDYSYPENGPSPLTLSVQLNQISGLHTTLTTALGPVLGLSVGLLLTPVLNAIDTITVTVPINLPLLETDNISISGKWSDVTQE